MNYNQYSYYRANPFAHNDFIPEASMTNRKPKEFPSQIPQGQEHLTSRPGRRIFRDKVEMSEIQRDNILKSPQRYPFENRIALNKQFKRNLETVDIEGAAAGTKVSESLRNKFKALEVLKQKDKSAKEQILTKSRLIGQSLDAVYQKKRRQLAVQMSKNLETRRSTQKLNQNDNKIMDNKVIQQNQRFNSQQKYSPKITNPKLVEQEYKRYVAHNSNQKHTGSLGQNIQYDGFQRYKRQQNLLKIQQGSQNQYHRGNSIKNNLLTGRNHQQQPNRYSATTNRGHSIQMTRINNNNNFNENNLLNNNNNNEIHSILNSRINPSNRYRSNPQYIESYSKEHQKRIQQNQKTRKIESTIQQTFSNNKKQFRRNNPTNLSFNIAARSSLLSTII